MADEKKEATKVEESAEAKTPGKKSDLMTYIIVGVGALLVTIGVMFAMIDTTPGAEHADATEDEGHQSSADGREADGSQAHDAKNNDSKNNDAKNNDAKNRAEAQAPDLFAELEDLSFLDDTNLFDEASANTEKLDASLDVKSGGKRLSKKDSLKALDWITTEKKKIAEKQAGLDKLKKRLDAQEHSIDQKLRQVDQAEAGKLNSLAKLYDGMKPEQVARMIVKLEDKIIVSILPRMKPANASKILGLMPPGRGARISKRMITLAGK